MFDKCLSLKRFFDCFMQLCLIGLGLSVFCFYAHSQSISKTANELHLIEPTLNNSIIKLQNHELSYQELIYLQSVLTKDEQLSLDCIKNSTAQFNKLDQLLKESNQLPDLNTQSQAYQYLIKKHATIVQEKIYCNYLNYKIKEVSLLIATTIAPLQTANKQVREKSSFELMQRHRLSQEYAKFLRFVSNINLFLILKILIIYAISFFITLGLCNIVHRRLKSSKHPFIQNALITYLPWVLPILVNIIYFRIYWLHVIPTPKLVILLQAILIYAVIIIIFHLASVPAKAKNNQLIIKNGHKKLAAFYIISFTIYAAILNPLGSLLKNPNILFTSFIVSQVYLVVTLLLEGYFFLKESGQKWFTHEKKCLTKYLSICISLILLYFISRAYLKEKLELPLLYSISADILLILTNLYFLKISRIIFNLKKVKSRFSPYVLNKIKHVFTSLTILIILIGFLGYHRMSIAFFPSLFTSILMIRLYKEATLLLKTVYLKLNDPKQAISRKLHYWLGVKPNRKLIELLIIRLILFNVPVTVTALFWLLEIWGASPYNLYHIFTDILQGFVLWGKTIQPIQILRASVVFCGVMLLGRLFATTMIRNLLQKEDHHMQSVISSLALYFFFILAFVISLLITDVEFTSLTVILGALSFGIGFGLQRIAADFLGGLFILFLKPIKIDDHVLISNTEGYIKNIGSLSTKIITLSNTEVSIPNSTIISGTVVNFTKYQTNVFRLKMEVFLEAEDDLEKAYKLLQPILRKNKHILHNSPNEPQIFFTLTSLVIWCYIDDIEKKDLINSEVSLAIVQAFKKHHIPMFRLYPRQPLEFKF